MTDAELLEIALRDARDTRALRLGAGVRHDAGNFFHEQFGTVPALLVSDANVFPRLGPEIVAAFRKSGVEIREPFVFHDPNLYAADHYVQELHANLSSRDGIPVALGAGCLNDITKLVAHRLGRQYFCIASAASMDGYTAFGSSITKDGLKQTFDCPAPAAVLADTESLAEAPKHLTAAGFGDLAAKLTAGADWIVADALGIEPIDAPAWAMVQSRLRAWLAGGVETITIGLMMAGFAMQRTRVSRPASGAEHQFSHLWDMQHHLHKDAVPWHGFKVAIGTLAVTAMYEALFELPLEDLDIDAAVSRWPERSKAIGEAFINLDSPDLQACGEREVGIKYIETPALREQLTLLKSKWPTLREKLRSHLIPFVELREMLRSAGCPTRPEEIGISCDRLRRSYRQAYLIRRRFTVLDLAARTGMFEQALDRTFGRVFT